MQLSPDKAAAEVLYRKQVRSSLASWAEHCGYVPARHHRMLIEYLEKVARGEIDRLAVFMPPGSAKSTYASILFPSWVLSQDPKAQFLAASHTTELAERWGRRVRNLVIENASILRIALSEEQAAGRWGLTGGGEYMAAGANVGIAGFRAKYGLIDDPIRSRQDADSLLVRDRIWDWYINDFRPRLIPRARQVLIQTRWHEDDLAGRCLNHQPWTVLSLPAFAKTDDQLGRALDEPLWADDDYGYGEQLKALRETTPPRVWSALYMCSPAPDEGDYFKEEWLKPVDILPSLSTMRTYGASDYAVTGEGGDFTVHVVFGVDPLNNLYLLDLWRGQKASDIWVEALCDLVQKYRPLAWAEEGGQIKSGIGPFLDRRMRERRVYVNRISFPTRGDKSIRARSIQGRMALDGLYYPKRAPWAADWTAELLTFPASKHDDQCVVEGTMISMAYGLPKPIEQVVVGDVVKTPAGPWRVDATAITDEAATVCRITFADGRTLTTTPNHRLFVHGKGLVRVDALGIMDQCVEEAQKLKLRNTKGIDIVDIPREIVAHINDISTQRSRVAVFFTAIYGKMFSDRSRLVTISTTKTTTGTITSSIISNASQNWSIAAGIRWLVRLSNTSYDTWRQFAIRLRTGTAAKRVALGIPNMAAGHGLADQYFQRPANAVTLRSRQNSQELPSAASRAGCVIAVEVHTAKARVRNLTVRHAHVYYANGVLSRNCDAMGLCGQLLDIMVKGRAGLIASPRLPRDDYKSDRKIKTIDAMTL